MIRLYILGGAAIAFAAVLAALWWQIDRNASLRAQLDAANSTITNSEEFNNAASNPDGLSWLERLGGVFPSAAD